MAAMIPILIAAAAISDRQAGECLKTSEDLGAGHHDSSEARHGTERRHDDEVESGPFSIHPPPLSGGERKGVLKRIVHSITFGLVF